jgi:hypothetical protein
MLLSAIEPFVLFSFQGTTSVTRLVTGGCPSLNGHPPTPNTQKDPAHRRAFPKVMPAALYLVRPNFTLAHSACICPQVMTKVHFTTAALPCQIFLWR